LNIWSKYLRSNCIFGIKFEWEHLMTGWWAPPGVNVINMFTPKSKKDWRLDYIFPLLGKAAHKMLLAKSTPGVNFINILRKNFSYKIALRSFSLVTHWLCSFLAQKQHLTCNFCALNSISSTFYTRILCIKNWRQKLQSQNVSRKKTFVRKRSA